MRHPSVNATFAGDAIERHGSANVASAIAVGESLFVPVITGCEQRSLVELAAARVDLVARARAGKLSQQDMEGGTFTISNLGPFGITQFIAVLTRRRRRSSLSARSRSAPPSSTGRSSRARS